MKAKHILTFFSLFGTEETHAGGALGTFFFGGLLFIIFLLQ
jgi:hypothetical protein